MSTSRRSAALLLAWVTVVVTLIMANPAQAAVRLSFVSSADTYVSSYAPDSGRGTQLSARASGSPTMIAYFKFDVSGIPNGSPVSSAILSLTGVNTQQSQIVSIRSMGNNWGENVTYNTRPTLGDVVAQGSMAGGATMTAQVPVNGNGTVSFAVTTADAGSTRNAVMATREDAMASHKPKLTVDYGTGTPAAALNEGDLTTVNGQRFVALNPSRPYSMTEYRYADGGVGHRVELRGGDVRPEDQQHFGDGRQRNELVGKTNFAPNADLWFSFSFHWSGQMPSGWVTIADLFSDKDACDGSRSGALTLQQSKGKLVVLTRSDPKLCSTSNPTPVTRYSQPFFAANTWHNLVGHAKFDPSHSNGVLELWIDNEKVLGTGPIPLGYNDSEGPHFSFGQYRGSSSVTTVFKFANEEISSSSLFGRVANPLPVPTNF